jgi:alpha-galactosidase
VARFFDHKKIDEALLTWAKMVARSSPIPPRIPLKPISGWRSSKEKTVSESVVMDRLENFNHWYQKSNISNLIFQLDGGFTPEAGDWLEINDNFPKGIKPLMTDIKKKGFIPGLNIAPCMVGNQSHLWISSTRIGSP